MNRNNMKTSTPAAILKSEFRSARGVHTLLETCGHYGGFRRLILAHLDLIYFDLKLADREAHRRYTGRFNDLILRNLAILRRLGFRRVALLPYNPTWLNKAAGLGKDRGYAHAEFMPAGEEERCRQAFDGFETSGWAFSSG